MAYNTNSPFGLRPVRYRSGAPWNGATNQYNIASGYATGLYNGDPVISLADGTVGIAAAGAQSRGLFMGVKYTMTTGQPVPGGGSGGFFWPASTTAQTGTTPTALIMDDNNVIMSAQETNGSGAAGTALALADRGLNINFYAGAGGSTRTGISSFSIDNATEATTSTLNLKIIDLDPYQGNAVGSFANWLVAWNVQQFQSVGTVGI